MSLVAPTGILLAAGRGARYGGDKLLAPWPAQPLLTVGEVSCGQLCTVLAEVVAVVRPEDRPLARLLAAAGARVLPCAEAADGMGASLACAIRATGHASGWVVALADMPWVASSTIVRVAEALIRGAVIAAPYYRGARGHPVGFGTACGARLAELTGDEGARVLLVADAALIERIDVDDAGILRDVDTPADLSPPNRIR